MSGPRHHALTDQQMAVLQLEMGRRAAVAGVVQFALFLVFYWTTPFGAERPTGMDAALAVIGVTVILRALLWRIQLRYLPDPRWLGRSKWSFRAVILVGAATWGLLAIPTVNRYGVSPPSMVLLIFLFGIALLSLQNFGLDLALVRAFVITITLPAALTLLSTAAPGAFALGAGAFMYLGFMIFLSRRSHALLLEALASRTTIQLQRDQLTAVLDALPGFAVWTDREGTVLGLNEKLATAYGAVPSELVGRRVADAIDEPELVSTLETFRHSPRGEQVLEQRWSTKAGPRWMLLALKRYGTDGQRLLMIGLDVGDRKRAEAERDEALARAFKASRLAELGAMAAGIGHEINNPLQALSYGLGILRLHLETPTLAPDQLKREGLRIVARASATIQRIAGIVQGLRSFAREDATTEFSEVDLRAVVRDLGDLGAATMPLSGVELSVDVGTGDMSVRGQRAKLGQVLLNLVNNARDALEGGDAPVPAAEKWVRVALRDLGACVEISVENGGPPIPETVRDQLMVPFFTTKDVGKGTGLGLSLSRAIVDQHGGRLYLDTSASHTRFVVVLPRAAVRSSSELVDEVQ